MILIAGATGHLGQTVIKSLLDRSVPSNEIIALARDKNKAKHLLAQGIQVRMGNYDDYGSLSEALRGVHKLLLISSSDMVDRLIQHQNVINAAKENGVDHIVYTGFDLKNFESTAIPHVTQIHADTTAYLDATGIPYTLLNNTLYADLIPLFCGNRVIEDGIFFSAGDGKTPFVARSEMGEATAVVLTTSGHHNRTYTLAADNASSFDDIAAILSEINDRSVMYHKPDAKTYVQYMVSLGVPEANASFLAGFGEAIKAGEFDTHRSDLKMLLGREPMSMHEFLTTQYSN